MAQRHRIYEKIIEKNEKIRELSSAQADLIPGFFHFRTFTSALPTEILISGKQEKSKISIRKNSLIL